MNGTNNTMIGLAAEAVGKEDNYAENTGYVYQYGRRDVYKRQQYILMSIQNMKAIRTEIRAGSEDLKVISIITI